MAELKMPPMGERRNVVQDRGRVELTRVSLHNQNSKSELDRRLDQALVETFPASDSIAVIIS
jgi:hypothetical protein